MSSVVSVLTQETAETIIMAGGTEPWTLDRKRASSSDFLMCCRKSGSLHSGNEEVGAAFLIGKIEDVVPSETSDGRWKITISHYARVEYAKQWQEGRKNPVAYWTTEKHPNNLGEVDYLDKLDFKPVHRHEAVVNATPKPMTVAEAKAGLALTFGIDESAIEITIRM
jgi:hypothetical protein